MGASIRVVTAVSLTLVLGASGDRSQPTPFSWAPLISLNEKRTVLIRVETPDQYDDFGSGIVVGPLDYILTASTFSA